MPCVAIYSIDRPDDIVSSDLLWKQQDWGSMALLEEPEEYIMISNSGYREQTGVFAHDAECIGVLHIFHLISERIIPDKLLREIVQNKIHMSGRRLYSAYTDWTSTSPVQQDQLFTTVAEVAFILYRIGASVRRSMNRGPLQLKMYNGTRQHLLNCLAETMQVFLDIQWLIKVQDYTGQFNCSKKKEKRTPSRLSVDKANGHVDIVQQFVIQYVHDNIYPGRLEPADYIQSICFAHPFA